LISTFTTPRSAANGAAEVFGQRPNEVVLVFDEHAQQAFELGLAPRQRPGVTLAERRAEPRDDLRIRPGCGVGGGCGVDGVSHGSPWCGVSRGYR
jgi:hypothetical protein